MHHNHRCRKLMPPEVLENVDSTSTSGPLPSDIEQLSRTGAVIQFGIRPTPKVVRLQRLQVREQRIANILRRNQNSGS
jgi:hypothetical protein